MRFAFRPPCIHTRRDQTTYDRHSSILNRQPQSREPPSTTSRRQVASQPSKLRYASTRPIASESRLRITFTATLGNGDHGLAVDGNSAGKLGDAILVSRSGSSVEVACQLDTAGTRNLANAQPCSSGNILFQRTDTPWNAKFPNSTSMGRGVPSDCNGPKARWQSSISGLGASS